MKLSSLCCWKDPVCVNDCKECASGLGQVGLFTLSAGSFWTSVGCGFGRLITLANDAIYADGKWSETTTDNLTKATYITAAIFASCIGTALLSDTVKAGFTACKEGCSKATEVMKKTFQKDGFTRDIASAPFWVLKLCSGGCGDD